MEKKSNAFKRESEWLRRYEELQPRTGKALHSLRIDPKLLTDSSCHVFKNGYEQ